MNKLSEGMKVHYRDSHGDKHTARISYIYTSAYGNECAALSDGATKLTTELWEAKQ